MAAVDMAGAVSCAHFALWFLKAGERNGADPFVAPPFFSNSDMSEYVGVGRVRQTYD